MADNETSKITWIAITVALAASVYSVTSGKLPALANQVLDNISKIAGKDTDTKEHGSDTTGTDNGEPSPTDTAINPNDAKWVQSGELGTNGYFVRDADGNGIVFAKDTTKPIVVSGDDAPQKLLRSNTNLKTVTIKNTLSIEGYLRAGLFESSRNLTTINGLDKINTSKATSLQNMFKNTAVTSLDLSTFDTRNVTNMASMFEATSNLKTVNLSSFDTSNVTTMYSMFDLSGIETLDITNFNTSKLTNTAFMFARNNLKTLDVSKMDVSHVEWMYSMFFNSKLTTLDLSTWDTQRVTDLSGMFEGSVDLVNLTLGDNFTAPNAISAASIFKDTTRLTDLNLSHFKIPNASVFTETFSGSGIVNLTFAPDAKAKILDSTFANMKNLKFLDLRQFGLYTDDGFMPTVKDVFSNSTLETFNSDITKPSRTLDISYTDFLGQTDGDPYQNSNFYAIYLDLVNPVL